MPYVENEIFKKNPFASLGQAAGGPAMQIAVEKGRKNRADISSASAANTATPTA